MYFNAPPSVFVWQLRSYPPRLCFAPDSLCIGATSVPSGARFADPAHTLISVTWYVRRFDESFLCASDICLGHRPDYSQVFFTFFLLNTVVPHLIQEL